MRNFAVTIPNTIHVFTIFKEGVTCDGPVKIVKRKNDDGYNVEKKVAFYKSLGYTVTEIQKH